MLPDTFYLAQGEQLRIAALPFVEVEQEQGEALAAGMTPGSSCNLELSLFGILPVKTVRAEVVERRQVLVCGTGFGIKMFASGVMVVGFSDLRTDSGTENPAKDAGLVLGDYLITVDGQRVRTNEQMAEIVSRSGGRALEVVYTHEGERAHHDAAAGAGQHDRRLDGRRLGAGLLCRDRHPHLH